MKGEGKVEQMSDDAGSEEVPVTPRNYSVLAAEPASAATAVSKNQNRGSTEYDVSDESGVMDVPEVRDVMRSGIDLKPTASEPDAETRVTRVWRGWLRALARDPEAALAAAQAYQRLDGAARSEWLRALQLEVDSLGVPPVALYAPLLAVESDPHRRCQIIDGIRHPASSEEPPTEVRASVRHAFKGHLPGGVAVAVLVEPLYLDFVQVLACAFVPGRELLWVRHDPIAARDRAPTAGSEIEGAVVEATSLRSVIDELASAVVAHRRDRGSLPEALCSFAHLFGLERPERGQEFLEAASR